MNKWVVLALSTVILASCSSPKYAYYFDAPMYNKAGKSAVEPTVYIASGIGDENPLKLDTKSLLASTTKMIPLSDPADKNENTSNVVSTSKTAEAKTAAEMKASAKETVRKYKVLSKIQRKEFRHAMRYDLKRYIIPSKDRQSN